MNIWERRERLLEHLLDNARVESLQIISGVYFLLDRGNVVYVGQSRDVLVRVRTHFKDDRKRFDKWAYLPVCIEELEQAERAYIDLFQPYLNQTMVRKPTYTRQRPRARRPPQMIVHASGLYANIPVTDAERQLATDVMDRILRDPKS